MRPQTQRRLIVAGMFVILVIAGGWITHSLVQAAKSTETGDDYAKGVVLTALSGALGSLLTLLGLIVKGLVDNLTGGKDDTGNQLSGGEDGENGHE